MYPLSRFGAYFHVYTDFNHDRIKLTIQTNRHPNFKRSFIDSYRMSVLAIFPEFDKMNAATEGGISDIVYTDSGAAPVLFELPIPPNFKQYIIILKVEGTEKGKLNDNVTVKGMKIIAAGELK